VTGPVQVLVVGFEQPHFSGEVLAEFARLRAAGIVRLVDLLLVTHGENGALETVSPPGHLPEGTGRLAEALLGIPEGSASDPTETADSDDRATWSLAEAIPVGTTAAVALLEHTWAGPLRDAMARSGGTPLDETWLAREDVELLETLLSDPGKG
jgi:hypothetical protein